jgi:heme/copper-type cytochrome/quinol oxidase subunit 2
VVGRERWAGFVLSRAGFLASGLVAMAAGGSLLGGPRRVASSPGVASRLGAAAPAATDRIDLVVSKQGFRPGRIAVRKGEAVRLSLTSGDGEHCFALDAFRIEKRVVPGRPSVVDLTPDRAGTFPFYDCLASDSGDEARQGRLVVTE